MIEQVVFLLEEPSAKDFLEILLPRLWGDSYHENTLFIPFSGKQDLEKKMVRKMKYWIRPKTQFIVMRDQDSADCKQIKSKLTSLCQEAGRADAIVRIPCRALESFFIGDWAAIAKGFNKPKLAQMKTKRKYHTPDALANPDQEIQKVLTAYQKREGARRITPFLDLENNKSRSFMVLVKTLIDLKSKIIWAS